MEPDSNILECIDIDEHCHVRFSNMNNIEKKGLGYYSINEARLTLCIGGREVRIRQNPNIFHCHKEDTGSVLWRASVVCLEYLLSQPWFICNLQEFQIIELGAGISGIGAILLGEKVDKYISTDREHILKYLYKNIDENLKIKTKIKGKQESSLEEINIYVMELNWFEKPKTYLKNLEGFLGETSKNLCILAFDTIYNPNITIHFVNTLVSIFNHFQERKILAIIGLELRNYDTLYDFLEKMQSHFFIQTICDEQLQKEYQIYIVQSK
ncbi:hypothetical protein T552_01919 [Pneumocystis carinii B80]|uniref:Uncharacterized protein n=1 Tax=Pneumocystis carinii (strain B80) TaxID=1408658 RepID=A0A0W4ZI70_PNEC8|nr:hypothetical protein T552_01919 [Pneumocystis carinii B80]KTW28057.1 hypothetical protein T552_01919 [Pneumocystis carinii B80]